MARAEGKENPNRAGVVVGTVYPLRIVDTGKRGDGVAFINGLVIFVRGANTVGDQVNARITDIRQSHALAEVVGRRSG